MKFHEMTDNNSNYISAYEENWLKIKNNKYTESILIFNDEIIKIGKSSVDQINKLILSKHNSKKLELIIIASKDNCEMKSIENYAEIIEQQIGFEFMTSESAYRTFNIVLSEDREVAILVKLS